MEKFKLSVPDISAKMHNRYDIEVVDSNNNVLNKVTAYNKAYPGVYAATGYIDKVVICGDGKEIERYIEPYNIDDPDDNVGDYWDRDGLPYSDNNKFVSCYTASVKFPYQIGGGKIDTVKLKCDNAVVSEAELCDIEGDKIFISYNENERIIIHVMIFITCRVGSTNPAYSNQYFDLYPYIMYDAPYSTMGGCCGLELDLVRRKACRYNHMGQKIDDGFMPTVRSYGFGFSKAPLPPVNENGYLTGCINSYEKIERTTLEGNVNKSFGKMAMKGLIRTMVIPGFGACDMREVTDKKGPFYKGVFQGSTVYCPGQCYLPAEYVKEDDPTLISITKNAFYNAYVTVRRFDRIDEHGNYVGLENAPLNKPYFSDLVTDKRERRCMGFSQHVPLTNDYCGAETIIPCGPGSKMKDGFGSWGSSHGYYLLFTGDEPKEEYDDEIDDNFSPTYIMASYAVTGEVVTENYEGMRSQVTFPYKLEYSLDGTTFETAVEFVSDKQDDRYKTPYTKIKFGPISAPYWRITSTMDGALVRNANNTTHSDQYVADAGRANCVASGYDPLFIFVGLDEDYSKDIEKEYVDSPIFEYNGMGREGVYHTLVPYTCFENSTYFVCVQYD